MTKTEQVSEIINLTREVAKDKNKKKRERKLERVRIELLKCPQKDVEQMYNEIIEKGAKKYYEDKEAQYKK